jgi:hypothetical protein
MSINTPKTIETSGLLEEIRQLPDKLAYQTIELYRGQIRDSYCLTDEDKVKADQLLEEKTDISTN